MKSVSPKQGEVIPINNFVVVKILETQDDTSGIEHTPWLTEHIGVYVHHKVSAASVLHHKDRMLLTAHTPGAITAQRLTL